MLGCKKLIATISLGLLTALQPMTSSMAYSHQSKFFRLDIDLVYRGKPLKISYGVACELIGGRSPDGDVTADGTGLVPFAWGQVAPDGGALVVHTPDVCLEDTRNMASEAPELWNPLIIHYEDSQNPWFGMGYVELAAYTSPLSVMKYENFSVTKIDRDEWVSWYKEHRNDNWLTWMKLGLTPDWFTQINWAPGTKKIPSSCEFAQFLRFTPQEKSEVVKKKPKDVSRFYADWKAYFVGPRSANIKNTVPSGFGRKLETYPIETDYSLNQLTADGKVEANRIRPLSTLKGSDFRLDDLTGVITRGHVKFEDKYRGFAFCMTADKLTGETTKHAFGSYFGAWYLNGEQLDGKGRLGSAWQNGAILDDEYFLSFRNTALFGMGGGL